jgi:hypothetical protein
MTTDSLERDQLDTVRIAAEGVAEMDRHRRVVFVAREDVIRLDVHFGPGAERPIVLLLVSLVCLTLAVGLMATFVMAVVKGGVRVPASLITGFTFLVPAWWFLDLATRKRWFVAVQTRTACRKLVFHGVRSQHEINQFVHEAKARHGYA